MKKTIDELRNEIKLELHKKRERMKYQQLEEKLT